MEKTFHHDVAHDLGREAARQRMEEGLPQLLAMLPGGAARHHWTGDTMFLDYEAFGQRASAQLEVFDDRVSVTVTVGGVLAAMGEGLAKLFGKGTQQMLADRRK
jgi:hypothetical protein